MPQEHNTRFFSIFRYFGIRVTLVIILVLGATLRLYKYPQQMSFKYDVARDILIARHTADLKFTMARPYASGGKDIIVNSPVYYWVLALLWTLTRSITLFMAVWLGLSLVVILFGYVVGRSLNGDINGLLTAMVISVSPVLVKYSHAVWQPHLLPLITVINYYFVIQYWRQNKPKWLLLLINGLLFGFHIHLSYFPFVLVGLLFVISQWTILFKRSRVSAICIALTLFAHAIVLNYLILDSVPADFVKFIHKITSCNTVVECSFGATISRYVVKPFQIFFEPIVANGINAAWLVIVVFGLASILVIIDYIRKIRSPSLLVASIMMSVAITSFARALINQSWYFASYYVVIPITSIYIITRYIHSKGIQVIFGVVLAIALLVGNQYLLGSSQMGEYQVTKAVARAIFLDYVASTGNAGPNLSVDWITPGGWYFEFDASPIWYHLEELFNTDLIKVVPTVNNISSLARNPDYYYLICEDVNSVRVNEANMLNECVAQFVFQNSQVDQTTRSLVTKIEYVIPYTLYVYRFSSQD